MPEARFHVEYYWAVSLRQFEAGFQETNSISGLTSGSQKGVILCALGQFYTELAFGCSLRVKAALHLSGTLIFRERALPALFLRWVALWEARIEPPQSFSSSLFYRLVSSNDEKNMQ